MKQHHEVKVQYHGEYQDLRDAGATMCEAIEAIAQANEISLEEVLANAYAEVEVIA